MSEEEEKRPLLTGEQKINEPSHGGVDTGGEGRREGAMAGFWARNKEKVPGYGMLKMVRQSGLYSLYVLAALLSVYLFNQLDRYTLPIVTTSMGPDIGYGDKTCQVNPHVNSSLRHHYNFSSSLCTSTAFQ